MSQGSSNTPPTTSEEQRQPPRVVPSQPRSFPEDLFPVSPTAIYGPNFPVLEQPLSATPGAPSQAETASGTGGGDLLGVSTGNYPVPSGSTFTSGPAGIISASGAKIRKPPPLDPSRPHVCDYPGCGWSFRDSWNLEAHTMQVHVGFRPYQCHACIANMPIGSDTSKFEFARAADLKRHQDSSMCVLWDQKQRK